MNANFRLPTACGKNKHRSQKQFWALNLVFSRPCTLHLQRPNRHSAILLHVFPLLMARIRGHSADHVIKRLEPFGAKEVTGLQASHPVLADHRVLVVRIEFYAGLPIGGAVSILRKEYDDPGIHIQTSHRGSGDLRDLLWKQPHWGRYPGTRPA